MWNTPGDWAMSRRVGEVRLRLYLVPILALLFGIALTASSALAGRQTDTTAGITKQAAAQLTDRPNDTPTPVCGLAWRVVSSPNGGTDGNFLSKVASVSANDIWAVGSYTDTGRYQTLTFHWDGASWSVISSPNAGNGDNFLNAVAAISTNDVWAVGSYEDNGGTYTLTLHWNGGSWSIIPTPCVFPHGNLTDVAATAANDPCKVCPIALRRAAALHD